MGSAGPGQLHLLDRGIPAQASVCPGNQEDRAGSRSLPKGRACSLHNTLPEKGHGVAGVGADGGLWVFGIHASPQVHSGPAIAHRLSSLNDPAARAAFHPVS